MRLGQLSLAIPEEPASDSSSVPWGRLTHTQGPLNPSLSPSEDSFCPQAGGPSSGSCPHPIALQPAGAGANALGSASTPSSSSHHFLGQVLTSRTSTNQ